MAREFESDAAVWAQMASDEEEMHDESLPMTDMVQEMIDQEQRRGVLHLQQRISDRRSEINSDVTQFIVFFQAAGVRFANNKASLITINRRKRSFRENPLPNAIQQMNEHQTACFPGNRFVHFGARGQCQSNLALINPQSVL